MQFAEHWNAHRSPPFEQVQDVMLHVTFDEETRPLLEVMLERLDALRRDVGAAYRLSSGVAYEEADHARADFIELFGTDLEMTPPLVVNEQEAYAAGPPCPSCGWGDAFDVASSSRLVIDESRLHAGVAGGPAPPPGGWDVVHLPNGDRLVSGRLAAVLAENRVEGYELHEVIDAATGTVSPRLFRLTAAKAVLSPCADHTVVEGPGFCPTCGTALGALEGDFHVRADWIGADEVISRHPRRGAMLYVSRRVLGLLEAASLSGMHRGGVLMVCRH